MPSRILIRATVLYLAAPVAVFLLGWLRWPLALASTAALAGSAWVGARRLERRDPGPEPASSPEAADRLLPSIESRRGLVAGCCVLLLVVSLLGAGGVGVQRWDWSKHSAVLADAVAQPWPVAYRLGAPTEDLVLVYYVAYYLPAALIGHAGGWLAANVALFVWTAIGTVLAWLWVARLGRASLPIALAVFLLWSGGDVLATLLGWSSRPSVPWWKDFDVEWWSGLFVYPDNVTLLAYAPNQALGGWLATGLTLDALRRFARGFPLALPATLCLLWSPFAALGLAALAGGLVLCSHGRALGLRGTSSLRLRFSFATLAIVAGVTLPLLLFFAARWPAPQLPLDLQPPPTATEAARLAFMPARLGPAVFAREWGRFLAIELLPLAAPMVALGWLAARNLSGADRFGRRLLACALLVLALVPIVSYGFYNDWAMRVSVPGLFALQVVSARVLSRAAAPAAARRLFATLLLLVGLYPASQLLSSGRLIAARGQWFWTPPVEDLFAQQRGEKRYYGFVEQYVASARAPFFRFAARPLEPRRVEGP